MLSAVREDVCVCHSSVPWYLESVFRVAKCRVRLDGACTL